MKALILISDRASPPTSGSKVRNFHLWRALSALGVEVKVLGMELQASAGPLLPDVPCESFHYKRQALPVRAVNSLLYSYHQWPYCQALERRLDLLTKDWRPDVIHAEEMRMAAYLPALRGLATSAKQTVTFHNVESELVKKTGSTAFGFGKRWIEHFHLLNLEAYERRILQHADICFGYSSVDKDKYLQKYGMGHWDVTSGGVALVANSWAEQTEGAGILLTGSLSYQPNVEGLFWFLDKVAPHLAPSIRVTIAGSNAGEAVRTKLAYSKARFIDTPASLAPLYKEHDLSIVPLLAGSGTRGRILESIGHGRAVVTTTIGAEGLELESGTGVHLADTPEAFAAAVNTLCKDKARRLEIARRGFAQVEGRYDWTTVARHLKSRWEAS